MSDIMNDVYGRADTEPREASGTDTMDVERMDAIAPDGDAESVDDAADTDVDDTQSGEDSTDGSTDEAAAEDDAASEDEARPEPGERGTTTVADVVVSKVVTMVAGKADGVYRLDDEDSEVVVDGRVATIRIALVVENGHAVTALAKRIRTDVIDAVEQGLGLDVEAVDVHVGDIHAEEEAG